MKIVSLLNLRRNPKTMDKPRKFCRHSDAAKEISIIKVITRVFKNKLIPGLREPPCLSLYCPCHSCKEICNYLPKPSLQWSSKIPWWNATSQPQYQIKKKYCKWPEYKLHSQDGNLVEAEELIWKLSKILHEIFSPQQE